MPKTNEEELDDNYFKGNNMSVKKMKLNKGEKRALKFMI
jgi:hypothetical protein